MTVIALALNRDQVDRLHRLAILARARAFEAQADAERAQAAWYAGLGDRRAAGEATDRAADLEREALLQLRSIEDTEPKGAA